MDALITSKGTVIDGVLIDERVFREEMVDYVLQERDDEIDHLINMISGCNNSDIELMKDDLKYLINSDDKYVFSSYLTNNYILEEDNMDAFIVICKRILKVNKELSEAGK